MPPRRTRASRAAAESDAIPNGVSEPAMETIADEAVNGSAEVQSATVVESKNGAKVNGKGVPISAAARKREKRKQRKREGSVASESDSESVRALSGR
jgi:hypothetical protein